MDLDDLQEKFGGISAYQVMAISIITLVSFGTSFTSQIAVFFSAVPDYRCAVPPIDNPNTYPHLKEKNITALMIPPDNYCYRYGYNLSECTGGTDLSCLSENQSEVGIIRCDYGYSYDDTYYEETTVSEWNLICDKRSYDSLANSIYFLGVFFGSAALGPLMDWFGRKMATIFMCFVLIASGIACTFSPTFEVYLALRFIEAFAGIPCFVAFFTYVSEISDQKRRTLVGMFAHLISGFAHSLLPALAYFLREWRDLSLACSMLPIPGMLLAFFFTPRSPRWLLVNGKENEAKKIVSRYAKSKNTTLDESDWETTVKTEHEKLEASSKSKKYTYGDLFRPPLMRVVTIDIMYLWFVASIVFYGLTLNVGKLAGDPYVNGTLNGFVEIIAHTAYLLFCYGIGRRLTSALSYFLSGICCLTTMLLAEFAYENQAMIEASRWCAIMGKLFVTVSFSTIYQYTTELYPTVVRGNGMSLGSMSARIGSIIVPFTLQIQEDIPWLTQTIFGGLGVLAGVSSLILPETMGMDLMTSVDEAENMYRKNMKLTSSLLGHTDTYTMKSDKNSNLHGQQQSGLKRGRKYHQHHTL